MVDGLPVPLSGVLFLILYRLGLVILFFPLLSFAFSCAPSRVLESPLVIISFPCFAISNAFALSRAPFFLISSLRSSLFLVFITASMMIAFSIVIGNSQYSPCSLRFVSKSANSSSGGQSMLKNLYNSKVSFQCASKWLFSFWMCDSYSVGCSVNVSISFWSSSPPTNMKKKPSLSVGLTDVHRVARSIPSRHNFHAFLH